MARVTIEGQELVVALSAREKFGALHGDVRVPLSAVRDVRVGDRPFDEIRGLRFGTGLPGVIALGTWYKRPGKDFVAVYSGRPGLVVQLEGAPYDRLILTLDDPQGMCARLKSTSRRGMRARLKSAASWGRRDG